MQEHVVVDSSYSAVINTQPENTALSQFDTDRTSAGRWTVTFKNPPINMFVPATIG